jgi:hypothetical protein
VQRADFSVADLDMRAILGEAMHSIAESLDINVQLEVAGPKLQVLSPLHNRALLERLILCGAEKAQLGAAVLCCAARLAPSFVSLASAEYYSDMVAAQSIVTKTATELGADLQQLSTEGDRLQAALRDISITTPTMSSPSADTAASTSGHSASLPSSLASPMEDNQPGGPSHVSPCTHLLARRYSVT